MHRFRDPPPNLTLTSWSNNENSSVACWSIRKWWDGKKFWKYQSFFEKRSYHRNVSLQNIKPSPDSKWLQLSVMETRTIEQVCFLTSSPCRPPMSDLPVCTHQPVFLAVPTDEQCLTGCICWNIAHQIFNIQPQQGKNSKWRCTEGVTISIVVRDHLTYSWYWWSRGQCQQF